MKILKYIFIVIVILIAAFYAVGLMYPQVEYGSEITVSKSIEEAWAVSQDESKYPLWLEGFQSMELIEGEYGEVGSKYKIIVLPGEGQPEFEMIETVVSKEENDHVHMIFDSEAMDFEQIISFSSDEEGTHVVTESIVKGKELSSKAIFALMENLAGAFTAQETKNMNNLKKVIEENTTDYSPEPEPVLVDSLEVAVEEVIEEVVE